MPGGDRISDLWYCGRWRTLAGYAENVSPAWAIRIVPSLELFRLGQLIYGARSFFDRMRNVANISLQYEQVLIKKTDENALHEIYFSLLYEYNE